MSNIYIQEPPTNGKVLLKTTAGDIDIELWSKEAPKACRNFIQLCLEAYYDNTIFHRVVPGFIVQGGDPTGTGTGGESIYGAPFKDEFHSRLRFNRRGLVAMANAGPHDNGSQFFFTLGRADELNNKHTIFGKVTGDTVYNMLRLTEVDIDDEERPRNPHRVKSCEVLFNPFDDIIPREIKRPKKEKPEEEIKKLKPKGTKNFSLLSFGEEAEEEEEEVNRVSQSMKGRSKSSHDLLKDDPHLSSVPAVESEKDDATGDLEDDGEDESADCDEYIDDDEKNLMRERIAKRLKKDASANVKSAGEGEAEKKPASRSHVKTKLHILSYLFIPRLGALLQNKQLNIKFLSSSSVEFAICHWNVSWNFELFSPLEFLDPLHPKKVDISGLCEPCHTHVLLLIYNHT
ncbi:Cwc27 [Phodopus roborovskii]|uniref:Spliceosome-associated protein CWC27 homolog n=1 Tax=Phodopus roborovskii TaxID=109678 RepID=A0AAU9Z4U5_PHORO|nr:Cwc27 [Phodopus roborovskii]